jgi:hypothetical protein
MSVAKRAAQSHANPPIQGGERETMAVLKISKPSLQRSVQVQDDGRQAVPIGSPGFRPNCVFELS